MARAWRKDYRGWNPSGLIAVEDGEAGVDAGWMYVRSSRRQM